MQRQQISGQFFDWVFPTIDMRLCTDFAAQYNLSSPVVALLLARGLNTKASIDEFLFPSSERDVGHTSQLQDAERAVERILYAIKKKEKILIAGDYDVDGITSTALLIATLLPLGADINFFLPNRLVDGYGLSVSTIKKAAASGYTIIMTVDNGITAHEAALEAKRCGVDLIITDHHKPHAQLPDAYAIVDPQRADCAYPFKFLAGVGVTFKLVSFIYEKLGKVLPQKAYELLLLGTVADVVPLRGENRYWVRHGLQVVNSSESASLTAMKKNGGCTKSRISATDIGFFLAPQLNALGRLEDPRHAVKFLVGTDSAHIHEIGAHLCELNERRKELEKIAVQKVQQRIESKQIDLSKQTIIIDGQNDFPAGVIGLVASRLVSQYGRPAIIFQLTESGIAKGSCRSMAGLNMFSLLESCSDILLKFGGHAQAAGLSILTEKLPLFRERAEQYLQSTGVKFDARQQRAVDATIALAELDGRLLTDLHFVEPFGNQNEEPIFHIPSVRQVYPPKLFKEAHVKVQFFSEGTVRQAIFFNRPELFSFFNANMEASFSVFGRATQNEWSGKSSFELLGIDVALEQ